MNDTNNQLISTNTVAFDTLQPIQTAAHDTCAVTVTGTTVVSVSDMPKDNQPNGWLQLLLPVFITLFVVFLDKWVIRYYDRKDEKESRHQYRETVLDWITKILPIQKAFNETVSKLAEDIKATDDMQPVPYAMPLTLHDKLGDMTVEKMTDAFLKDFAEDRDKRYAHMYNIISNLEFLSKISNSVKESYDSYNKQSFALCQEWNNAYVAFVNSYNGFSKDNPYKVTVENWWKELLTKPSSVKVHLTYLDKLDSIAFETKDYDTLSLVNKMHLCAKQSQATSKGFATVFLDIADNIDNTLNSLSADEQYFRKNESVKK